MKVYVGKDYEQMSKMAADFIAERIANVKVLGLATGSTPVGMYKELIEKNKKNEISFKNIKTVNLDEYIGLPVGHKESYREFMNENLFDHIDINKNDTHVPFAKNNDDHEACKSYDELIDSLGGVDIQVLGVGENGHIAFNEPSRCLSYNTNIITLTESTIKANSRFFDDIKDVPTSAISMGVGKIMEAKTIILLANGPKKADAIRELLKGNDITTDCPVTLLKLHKDVYIFIDEQLNELLWLKKKLK